MTRQPLTLYLAAPRGFCAGVDRAIKIVQDDQPQRARRVLELLSDPTDAPIDQAPGKSAAGAWRQPD